MIEKKQKELEKFVEENGYNDKLKDIYLREILEETKNTDEIKFPTKHSTSYKHSLSYWYFCYCFKDRTNSRGV